MLAHREHCEGEVLIVEDTAAQAAFFTGVLGAIGLRCDIVKSAEHALERLSLQGYDLVLMDLLLAGCMSGVTLANQIRRLPGVRAT